MAQNRKYMSFAADVSQDTGTLLTQKAKELGLSRSQAVRLAIGEFYKKQFEDFDPTQIPEINRDLEITQAHKKLKV